jgi:hypothetical protein
MTVFLFYPRSEIDLHARTMYVCILDDVLAPYK